jgi:hypothetical protein
MEEIMKRSKFNCFILLLAFSIIAGNCYKKSGNNPFTGLPNIGGGTGGSCDARDAFGYVYIDGTTLKEVYVDLVEPQARADYNSGSGFSKVTLCFDASCTSEKISIYFPGQETGAWTADGTGGRYIEYANGTYLGNSSASRGGSGTISITNYDICFIEGTFWAVVYDKPSGGTYHTLMGGNFNAFFYE